MDPLTHGLTGALIGKAFFAGAFSANSAPDERSDSVERARVSVAAVTTGAVFPDCDFLFNLVIRDPMTTLEWHRGVTHSLVCLPVFALVVAALVRWHAARRGRSLPPWRTLLAAAAAGVASHILLDIITSWGTMVWSPLSRSRVSWDWVFIIDLTFTAIVLLPQLWAWVYSEPARSFSRAVRAWAFCAVGVLMAAGLTLTLGVDVGVWMYPAAVLLVGVVLFAPRVQGLGFHVRRETWCRAGLAALALYFVSCAAAHSRVLALVEQYAASQRLHVERIAAVPMPPSLLHWEGLVRAPNGVHRASIHLFAGVPVFRFVPDAVANGHIAAARALPRVETYLWFARFPSIQYFERDSRHIVEFSDLRFFAPVGSLRAPFTFRVVFDATGKLVEQGWAVEFE